ncbi:MAG: transposase, partial [Prevotella sp.]|nr:transposase [Prevotella sp.]
MDNAVENEIRPVTLGRKNYLFCGNPTGPRSLRPSPPCSIRQSSWPRPSSDWTSCIASSGGKADSAT